MGRIKFKTLMKRGSKDAVFPKTAAKQVIFADGKNAEDKINAFVDAIPDPSSSSGPVEHTIAQLDWARIDWNGEIPEIIAESISEDFEVGDIIVSGNGRYTIVSKNSQGEGLVLRSSEGYLEFAIIFQEEEEEEPEKEQEE